MNNIRSVNVLMPNVDATKYVTVIVSIPIQGGPLYTGPWIQGALFNGVNISEYPFPVDEDMAIAVALKHVNAEILS